MNYPAADLILKIAVSKMVRKYDIDLDDLIYDTISDYDQFFEGDNEWFDEEDTDMKDSLRDQVLESLQLDQNDTVALIFGR
ncbi:hypothetical protein [Synechococcus sp. CBW1004]|uniref:hypothetical protein n=1 Tax=Synechococcus sp. CBW1004 TaxID=1353136 RepID=UPI0018CE493E|nr:hypothetical protein [Synechococcus sp. CBW1004]QPN64489.1 hypothetical protein H8F25_07045 [Synechococcus sp. CBW1004]